MSLDGLRAWIGEVERKLDVRTRVFLVLAVIAIGGAGAAIYLAADTRTSAVSESDVRVLQEQLEARIDEGGGSTTTGPEVAQLEAELEALRTQVEQLEGEGGSSKKGAGEGSTGGGASSAEPQELLEHAKEESEKGE